MPRISFIGYNFTPPDIPISIAEYQWLKLMSNVEYKKYIKKISADLWTTYRADNINFLYINISFTSICVVIGLVISGRDFPVFEFIILGGILLGLIGLISSSMSILSFLKYKSLYIQYLKKQRRKAIKSNTYEDFLNFNKNKKPWFR